MVEAKRKNLEEVSVWGTGSASREFFFVEDAAKGIIEATKLYDESEPVNLGTNEEITIKQLVETLKELTGFSGAIKWDTLKPDGQPRRALDVSRAKEKFGFESKTELQEGLRRTIKWYKANVDE
jgi:GDP-L-fucose synthase